MGRQSDVICSECGQRYTATWGGTFGVELLHCEDCGSELAVDRAELTGCADVESIVQPCLCGGRFTQNARPRCPSCGSPEHVADPEGSTVYLD